MNNFVTETLLLASRTNVETTAVIAKYNPFFEKAEMGKIVVRLLGIDRSSDVDTIDFICRN